MTNHESNWTASIFISSLRDLVTCCDHVAFEFIFSYMSSVYNAFWVIIFNSIKINYHFVSITFFYYLLFIKRIPFLINFSQIQIIRQKSVINFIFPHYHCGWFTLYLLPLKMELFLFFILLHNLLLNNLWFL